MSTTRKPRAIDLATIGDPELTDREATVVYRWVPSEAARSGIAHLCPDAYAVVEDPDIDPESYLLYGYTHAPWAEEGRWYVNADGRALVHHLIQRVQDFEHGGLTDGYRGRVLWSLARRHRETLCRIADVLRLLEVEAGLAPDHAAAVNEALRRIGRDLQASALHLGESPSLPGGGS